MLDLFCAKNRLRKHQIFEKWDDFENWPSCKSCSRCKIGYLGSKINIQENMRQKIL